MANGTDRTHRMTGEAFQRLRNDHEQFLEAYEKPTQIYRFLKTRQSLKPLFLHRNLSYMPRHSRSKRNRYRKKMKLDDLLSHTREVKPDLASEIKSDNHLKISFCGIEEGFSFKGLLADNASDEDESGMSGKPVQDSSRGGAKLVPGQVVEVEILLLKFKQSSVRLSEGSYPYSCHSLGKQILKYKAATEEKGEGVAHPPLPPSGGQGDLTLTIPESLLTWKGDRTPGTQMLVFKATCVQRQPKKKPLHLYNFASRRKNAVVQVNRLNIGQSMGKPKVVSSQGVGGDSSRLEQHSGVGVGATSLGQSVGAAGEASCGGQEQVRNSTQTPRCQGAGNCEEAVGRGAASMEQSLVCDVGCSAHDKNVGAGGGEGAGGERGGDGKGKTSLSKHGLLQKKSKSKLKRAKMDASVMTEISYGTEIIPDMGGISHNPFIPNGAGDHSAKANQSAGTFSALSDPTFSPPTAKKGFVHRCTSPKIRFVNGSNGLLNGYAIPEVAAALKARRGHQTTVAKSVEPPRASPVKRCTASPIHKPLIQKKSVIRKRIVKINNRTSNGTGNARFKQKIKIPAGSGKTGMRSFLVSYPRLHYDRQPSVAADRSAHAGSSPAGRHKRRSQTEMLLDGDKPRGQRLSESGIPVFVAEDISNRSSSGSASGAGSHALWLESSTRKITPVEHFAYSIPSAVLSPTKRTSSSSSATSNEVSRVQSSSPSGNHRKRISEVAGADSPPLLLPPPVKQPKVVPDASSAKESEREKEVGVSKGTGQDGMAGEKCAANMNGFVQPLLPPPVTQLVTTPIRTEATPPISTTTVFSAELVVFDSRGECLVRDGSYSILLQCCTNKNGLGLSTFEPLTWSSVFGSEKTGSGPVEESPNLMLKFSVCWLHGPPQHRLCSELDTALDIKKIREEYFPPPTPALDASPPSPSILAPPLTTAAATTTEPAKLELLTTEPKSEAPPSNMSTAGELVRMEHDYTRGIEDSEQALDITHLPTEQHFSKVLFNFLYSNNSLQQTECRAGWVCPWCSLSCGKIYSLLKHMSICHPRFHFTYTPQCDGKCVINVHVNKMYNAGSSSLDRDPGERSNVSLIQRRKGPSKCLSCSAVLVEKHTVVKEDLSEFLNDGSWKRGYNTNRTYYHSRLCLPMLPKELEAEKEELKQTLEWQNVCSHKMIDEFTDVNGGEKELMKLWNIFSMENRIIADKQIPQACLDFARKNGQLLQEKGLVPNLMSHLVNLYDFGLITPAALKETMAVAVVVAAGVS